MVGMTPSALRKLKANAHACLVNRPCSRSATIDLNLEDPKLDPTGHVRSAPVVDFLASLWNETLPRDLLLRSWTYAAEWVVGHTWRSPIGPLCVAALSLSDASWTIKKDDPFTWVDKDGGGSKWWTSILKRYRGE